MPTPIIIPGGPSRKSLHRLDSFLRCKKDYAIHYKSGIKMPVPKALARGTLVHVGQAQLEARRWCVQNGIDPETYMNPLDAIDITAEAERHRWGSVSDTERPNVISATRAYMANVDPLKNHRVLFVEQEFEFHVTGPRTGRTWSYTQKPDLICEEGGYVFIDDAKSSAVPSNVTLSRYAPSIQFVAFRWWGPTVFGPRFGGARIRLIGMDNPHTFTTVPIGAAPQLVRQFPQMIEDTELELERLEQEGRSWEEYPPVMNERVCMSSYGRCDSWDLCLGGSASYTIPLNLNLTQIRIPSLTAGGD
jgi:hypothetical protein